MVTVSQAAGVLANSYRLLTAAEGRSVLVPFLWFMTLGLRSKYFPRAHTALANEVCDLVRDLVCGVHFF
jgi:hypothetical protein